MHIGLLHRSQRLIVLSDLACHGTLFDQINCNAAHCPAGNGTILVLLLLATTSALKNHEQVVWSRQQDFQFKHTLVKHQCGVYSITCRERWSKYYNTQWD